ncbi:hypothetical protein I4U23_022840 [Adineta vaga]|nr:hypothetical protein I4U23_022840 [Adineta vaga]
MQVIGSESMTFEQDAIEIIYLSTKEDIRILNFTEEKLLSENFHPYLTVSSTLLCHAVEIMQHIRLFCPKLSGQLDTLRVSIEFHDFDSFSTCTRTDIEYTLNMKYQQSFKVTKTLRKIYIIRETPIQRNTQQIVY